MDKIASFTIDHRTLMPGIYLSRTDGDVTTYDLRTRRPNTGDLMTNQAMHSVEHLFATLIRNGPFKEDVIYFGPMGCQTGFYLLMRGANHEQVIAEIRRVVGEIATYSGEMPGKSAVECGNYRNLSVDAAREE